MIKKLLLVILLVTILLLFGNQLHRINLNVAMCDDLTTQNLSLQERLTELEEYRTMMTDYDIEQNKALQILENMFDVHEAEQEIINNGIMSNEELQLKINETIENYLESFEGKK